ncbi:hypothetical protein GCM10018793_62520 [Streptomyces sulfonofaciens]|uniref:Polysaccharide pyruvyl transferase domain-containing protein n=2 Tax=Streptomyces sulfonofaciens TaxID=68272 RepID=A0A919GNF5_9ACTN|nr:hypothetical protein GCM10018793_62520 [Streptomyces sulfonofaciens]
MPHPVRRILLRSGKSPFTALSIEDALHQDVIATNAGNLIFSDAAHKILSTPGTEVVSNGMRTEIAAAERINDEFDVFVVPLANAFRPSFELPLKRLTRLISKLRIPVVVLGVGAQAGLNHDRARLAPIEPSVKRFVSAVLDRSACIGVRGEFTEQYLKDLGFRDVDVIGCPSLFWHGDRLTIDKADTLAPGSRIALNGSHSAMRNKRLAGLLRRTWEQYEDVRFIGQNLSEARALHWRDMSDGGPATMPTHPAHPLYRDGKVRVYIDPVTWIRELRGVDYSLGSRIHGNIAALLAGTPCTVLCADSRTLELARYFEIPHHKLTDLPADPDAADLYAAADFGPLMKGHKERFERFTGFLAKNGLENTFEHGDQGAEFEARMSEPDFPPAVRPWNTADLTSVSERFNWLHSRLDDVTKRNTVLERALARLPAAASAQPRQSVYRRARRAVGRPLKRALQAKG